MKDMEWYHNTSICSRGDMCATPCDKESMKKRILIVVDKIKNTMRNCEDGPGIRPSTEYAGMTGTTKMFKLCMSEIHPNFPF
jgi:hypothetical protein